MEITITHVSMEQNKNFTERGKEIGSLLLHYHLAQLSSKHRAIKRGFPRVHGFYIEKRKLKTFSSLAFQDTSQEANSISCQRQLKTKVLDNLGEENTEVEPTEPSVKILIKVQCTC